MPIAIRCLLFALAALAGLPSLGPRPALAQEQWLFKTALQLQTLAFDPACRGSQPAQDVYILGIRDPDALLTPSEATRIVAQLSDFITTRTPFSVTKADNFGVIARSYTGNSQANIDELMAAMSASERADLTLVLQPYDRQGSLAEIELRAWTRDGAELVCAPSFRVTVPTGTADPTCARNFQIAKDDGSAAALEFFIAFSATCPEIQEARQALAALERDTQRAAEQRLCEQRFQSAVAQGTEAAFSAFLAEHGSCPEAPAAVALMTEARKTGQCQSAFAEAREANTLAAYQAFLLQRPLCPEVAAAQVIISSLLTAPKPEPEPEPEPDLPPVEETPRFDMVLYRRNAEIHIGDETIRNWPPVVGVCHSFWLDPLPADARVTIRYQPFGVEAGYVELGAFRADLRPQQPRAGKTRPNYWGAEDEVTFILSRQSARLPIRICGRDLSRPGQKADYDDFILRRIVLHASNL